MNVLIDSETYRLGDHRIISKQTKAQRFIVVEMDGTEDGRLIARFEQKPEMLRVIAVMGWTITEDNCIAE